MLINFVKKSIVSSLIITAPSLSVAASLCNGYETSVFGPQVCVFDSSQSHGIIQNVVSGIHDYEKNNQFGSMGYALLFKAGKYPNLSVPVGYYTQVQGLGISPDKTIISTVKVDADDLHDGTSLNNFWRSGENFSVDKNMVWAVSQASPLRNLHVPGVLVLGLGGDHYASGGFLANSKIDTGIASSGQQQWLTRNTIMGKWFDPGVWDMVFVGDINAPADDSNQIKWQNFPNTINNKTPRIQEKPYLIYNDTIQKYQVIVPSPIKSGSSGVHWQIKESIIPQSQFIVVKPGMDADKINTALKNGKKPKALIFTPGQYGLTKSIQINQANTVVLGLGVPVLTAVKPHLPVMVSNAAGIKIAGILFEAGSNTLLQQNDPSLLVIGIAGQDKGNQMSPTTLSDVYCRVGGRITAQTNSCITINESYVIGDNLWLWRADHGAGAGSWTMDQANHGLIVKGHDVTMYGLAVEHFIKNQVMWNGERGSVYFYQSELPYDVPTGFMVPASFKVGNNIKEFKGYGFGVYSYFRANPGYALSAIEAPNSALISFTHMVVVTLPAKPGTIQNMIRIMPEGKLWQGPFTSRGIANYSGIWTGQLH